MDIAIVTGAETPLGLRIVQTLVQQGYRVHGLGNNFAKVTYADSQFKGHAIDLTDVDAVSSTLDSILQNEQRLDCLIHAVDVTPGTPFEKLAAGNLEAILKIGLFGPAMMTRLALPNLLRFRGQLINVITANKHGHPASAANALIEGGLREMNKALFDRSRDAGLRVTNCVLRQNTELSDGSVSDGTLAQSHINLDDVARSIEQLIDSKAINVPAEIVLHPRLSAAAAEALPKTPLPLDPYSQVVLPPKAYCPPEEPRIPTQEKQQVERTIPYTDEEMEDKIAAAIEDYEAHPERYDQPDPVPAKQAQGGSQQGNSPQSDPQQEGQGKNKRRRRRRGGRNRNKKPQYGDAPKQENISAPQAPKEAESQPSPKKSKPERSLKDKSAGEAKPRTKENPRPNPEARSKKKTDPKPGKGSPDAAAKVPESPAAEKNVTKKTVKKVAKKAAKKAAKKKTAAKKAAKKKATKKAVRKVAD